MDLVIKANNDLSYVGRP